MTEQYKKEENFENQIGLSPEEITENSAPQVPPETEEEKVKKVQSVDESIKEIYSKRPTGEEPLHETGVVFTQETLPVKKENWLASKWHNALALLGLAGAMATLPQQAEGKSAEDSLKKQNGVERIVGGGEDSLKKKSNVKVYTTSKTKEGAITPTGLSNSFLENPYGVTEADISLIANHYGFSTESNAAFQRDMYNFVKDNNPELIKEILEKYGQTEQGGSIDKNASLEEQIKGLIDNMLGARDAFTIAQLKKILEVVQEKQKSSPQEVIKEIPQPTGKYVINVRGDEQGRKGVYYFFDTEKKFKEASDAVGHYLSREIKGGEGQATINMNADVFLDRYANGKEDLLGIAWERDGKNQYKFFTKETKSTTAHYTDGFVKAE